jgi:hypothetical protein
MYKDLGSQKREKRKEGREGGRKEGRKEEKEIIKSRNPEVLFSILPQKSLAEVKWSNR